MNELVKLDVFKPFYLQLEEIKEANKNEVFDYESIKGNKAARSHIYKLRQSKAVIEKVRKEEKAGYVEAGRELDKSANALKDEFVSMIELHAKPIKAIEEREVKRIADIKERIESQFIRVSVGEYQQTSEDFQSDYDKKFNIVIDDSYAEFKTEAFEVKDAELKRLLPIIESCKKQEAEQAELEQLRKDKLISEQKERDEAIKKQAREKAENEAKERELEIERAKVRAEEQAKESERQKEQAIENAKQREIERQNAEQQAIADEQAKRESNNRHIGNIRKQAKEDIMSLGLDEAMVKKIIMAIHNKEIRNLTINY